MCFACWESKPPAAVPSVKTEAATELESSLSRSKIKDQTDTFFEKNPLARLS